VVIAAIVLLTEGIAAVRTARANRLQSSLNLALGSALATIGLTIPIVAIAALSLGRPLVLGLGPAETVLLLLTLFISTVFATGRTTILQVAVHLVIFAVFLLLAVVHQCPAYMIEHRRCRQTLPFGRNSRPAES
jgi:Ca2+:H+ antiporter